jgi:hypothetical protein
VRETGKGMGKQRELSVRCETCGPKRRSCS